MRLVLRLLLGLEAALLAVSGVASAQAPVPVPGEVPPDAVPKMRLRETKKPKPPEPDEPSSNVVVPLVMYTPETHVGVGGIYVHFFRPRFTQEKVRVSSLGFVALGTSRLQLILEVHPDFYFSNDDLHVFGKIEYQYYPDSFWGVGPRTPNSAEERYKRQRFRWRPIVHHRIVGPLYAGLALEFMNYTAKYSADGIFANVGIPGERGGITTGFGPTAVYDTRDNSTTSHSGTLLSASMLWFRHPISRYTFQKLVLEARQFFDLGHNHAIGTRFYGEVQGGHVPYYQLALLGGDELLRGYYLGRYRDETLGALETEYRYPLFWKFGGVLFAGAGEVAPTVGDLFDVPLRWAVGGGLRFSLSDSERLNLRLDAGFGPGTWGIYLTGREAW